MDSIRRIPSGTQPHAAHGHAPTKPQGPQDSVELGNPIPDHNCWDPRTFKTQVRAEVAPRLDALKTSDCSGIVHTTRGLPRESMHQAQAPRPFAAGRFAVTFRDRSTGDETAYIFQTEDGPGHLGHVVPGKTEIPGGFISILADPKNVTGPETRLNGAEVDRLLDRVHDRFKTPMTDEQSNLLQSVLDYGYAIRYAGQGEAAVAAAAHQRIAG